MSEAAVKPDRITAIVTVIKKQGSWGFVTIADTGEDIHWYAKNVREGVRVEFGDRLRFTPVEVPGMNREATDIEVLL